MSGFKFVKKGRMGPKELCDTILWNGDDCEMARCELPPHPDDPWHEALNQFHDFKEPNVDIRWKNTDFISFEVWKDRADFISFLTNKNFAWSVNERNKEVETTIRR